ncbi:MAG: hypothetical protein RLZZ595_929 [Bacteroidota bacterium]|jgi:uncharacterized protein YigE (DUF2233 family)
MLKSVFALVFVGLGFLPNAQTYPPDKIKIYWKDSNGAPYMTFDRLRTEHPEVKFIMNTAVRSGMGSPVGLYIENGKQISSPIFILNSKVNVGIQPMGVFFITTKGACIQELKSKVSYKDAVWAIQSGPLLVMNGKVNPRLPKGKAIPRNGIGIKKDGQVYFACLKMGYRDFANHFLKEGCIDALYLEDGLPESYHRNVLHKRSAHYGPMIVVE